MRNLLIAFCAILLLTHCASDKKQGNLGHMEAVAQMVQAGVKPIGISVPLSPDQAEELFPLAKQLAEAYQIKVTLETDLLVTPLFPASGTEGKHLIMFYQAPYWQAYQTLKEEGATQADSGTPEAQEEIARRFGRLLGYPHERINALLAANTDFRTIKDFGLRGHQVVFYYQDLDRATQFYEETLGLRLIASYPESRLFWLAQQSYLLLVADGAGMHHADEPKSVALALLTEQLGGWWDHLNAADVPIRYGYTPRERGPHDGFVAIDPEGYLLEFETFKQHPENEHFMPLLRQNMEETLYASDSSSVSPTLGFHSTITWLYYQDVLGMQNFYQEVLGLSLVADQGWCKIYQAGPTGFVGLVDERRGMNDYTDTKAVNVSFLVDDLEGWEAYAPQQQRLVAHDPAIVPAVASYRRWVGYDPEGYTLEIARYQADSLPMGMEHPH